MNDPCSMREPSQAEIARWKSYARQHNPCLTPSAATACRNQVDADGNWVFGHVHGCSLYDRDEYGRTTFSFAVHVITPVLALPYNYRTMEPKGSPVLFDRHDGQIIVPGYCCREFVQSILPLASAHPMLHVVHQCAYQDILLSPRTDTIAIHDQPHPTGEVCTVEALAPGSIIIMFDQWIHPRDRFEGTFVD